MNQIYCLSWEFFKNPFFEHHETNLTVIRVLIPFPEQSVASIKHLFTLQGLLLSPASFCLLIFDSYSLIYPILIEPLSKRKEGKGKKITKNKKIKTKTKIANQALILNETLKPLLINSHPCGRHH